MKLSQEGYIEYESQGVIIRLWSCGKYEWNIRDSGWNASDKGTMPLLGLEVDIREFYQFLIGQHRKREEVA